MTFPHIELRTTATPDWTDAACATPGVDPDLWFTDEAKCDAADCAVAVSICGDCDVREACLEFALGEDIQHGIWGGLTTDQRMTLRRRDPLRHKRIVVKRFEQGLREGKSVTEVAERMGLGSHTYYRYKKALREAGHK